MLGKMVIDDNLLITYESKKNSKNFNILMRKLKFPHATNFNQMKRLFNAGFNIPNQGTLLSQLSNKPEKDYDLERLSSETIFKMILTDDKTKGFPYVYFKDASIDNCVVFSLSKDDSRDNLVSYLQRMCEQAEKITICDNYFAQNPVDNKSLFNRVFPRKDLHIEYSEAPANLNVNPLSSVINNSLSAEFFPGWVIRASSNPKYSNSHDRYLLIESPGCKVEVMLSSGFEHIWKRNPKEITCVFSEVN